MFYNPSLTKEGVGEPVPLTAGLSGQPPTPQARGETERGPEDADQDVAQADVEQDQVDGGPQATEPGEDQQRQAVVEGSRH